MSQRISPTRPATLAPALLACALGCFASEARAQEHELHLATLERGGWPETVAALQADLGSQGTHVHVVVFDSTSHLAPCGRYQLALDLDGARAFGVGACDPSTSATDLVLVSRTDLFRHDGVVPQPRAIRLRATEVRTGDEYGGAASTGGSALDCSVGVRPYLDDLEHGTVVYLTPERFEVRPTVAAVTVESTEDGWSLHAQARAAMVIEYDVVDRVTHETVLHDRATLTCSAGRAAESTVAPTPAPTPRQILVLPGTDLEGRASEVVGVIDVRDPSGDEESALRTLRARASELGADAVLGVELHRVHVRGAAHLTGLAVRFVDLARDPRLSALTTAGR